MTYNSSFQDRAAQAAQAKQKALEQYRARPPIDEKRAAEREAAKAEKAAAKKADKQAAADALISKNRQKRSEEVDELHQHLPARLVAWADRLLASASATS